MKSVMMRNKPFFVRNEYNPFQLCYKLYINYKQFFFVIHLRNSTQVFPVPLHAGD